MFLLRTSKLGNIKGDLMNQSIYYLTEIDIIWCHRIKVNISSLGHAFADSFQ